MGSLSFYCGNVEIVGSLHVISRLITIYDTYRGFAFFRPWYDMGLLSLLGFSYDHARSVQIELGWIGSVSVSSVCKLIIQLNMVFWLGDKVGRYMIPIVIYLKPLF